MPKETVYTCDCCGKTFKEPQFNGDPYFSEMRFSLKKKEEDRNHLCPYELKEFTNDATIYLCEKCTNELLVHLKQFGFKELICKEFFGSNKIIKL